MSTMIRFTIEERHLTDPAGKPVANEDALFHSCEANSADEAVRLFIRNSGELLGNILQFPGFQAVATVRKSGGVYTLQVSPSSQNRIPIT